MIKRNIPIILLWSLFLIIFAVRLTVSLNLPNFSSDEAYFHLRHVLTIIHERTILTYDPLSYGGRTTLYPPFYHILLAFTTFGSTILLKIIPELFAASFVFVAYALSKTLTDNAYAALAAALLANTLPLYLIDTLNAISITTLIVPLLFLILYMFINIEEKKHLSIYILLILLIAFLHSSAFLIIATFIVYFLLLAGGALNPSHLEREAVWYALLTILLVQFLLFHKAFLTYGLTIIWQNTPLVILADTFRSLNIFELIFALGILPIILGASSLYLGITREKKKSVYVISALMLAVLILLVLRLITITTGLMLLGSSLAILSPLALVAVYQYIQKTRLARFAWTYPVLIIVLISTLALYPMISRLQHFTAIPQEKINDLRWARDNLPENATILGNINEGNLIATIAQRKNVLDQDFVLAPNAIERLNDVDSLYRIVSIAKAKQLVKKYDITAIYYSSETQAAFDNYELKYAHDRCYQQEGGFYIITC